MFWQHANTREIPVCHIIPSRGAGKQPTPNVILIAPPSQHLKSITFVINMSYIIKKIILS
jgi:hypothetical protein